MNTEGPDLAEVFETLSSPLAVCDPDGWLLTANDAAWQLLGVERESRVRLALDDRETLSAMRTTKGGKGTRGRALEFFLADVRLEGAAVSGLAASVAPLDFGGFRVSFVEQREQEVSPTARVFNALSSVTEHIALFDEVEQVLPLFGTSLRDIFLDCAARIEVWHARDCLYVWEDDYEQNPKGPYNEVREVSNEAHVVETGELLWQTSVFGVTTWFDGEIRCGMQLETRRAVGLSGREREAAEVFVHVMGLFMQRVWRGGTSQGKQDRLAAAGEVNRLEVLAPVLDQLEAAVALCDARRVVRSCNESFSRALMRPMGELRGLDVVSSFGEPVASALRLGAAKALTGDAPEVFMASVPGYDMEVSIRMVPLQEVVTGDLASQRGFLLVLQPATRSFAQARDKIERAEHLLQVGQLASGVAHELKNPMTSIMNYADYLLQKYRDQLFEKRDSERLVRIIEGVERMDVFIRDLVLLAKPSSGEEVATEVNLHDVIRQACHLCEITFSQHQAQLERALHAERPVIWGVNNLLVQVFVNLLSNSASALTEEGGKIVVHTIHEDAEIVCEVSDDGCGMDSETLARIFEPFYTRRRNTGGSGLGLPLVRTLVERHSGSIAVTSELGQGTRVSLRFPRWQEVHDG